MYIRNVRFLEATRLGFRHYFRFSGRAQRAEFWWFQLFLMLVTVILMIVDMSIFGYEESDPEPFSNIWLIVTFIPTLSIGWRRMHDIGKSGWWSLLWAAPIIWTAVAAVTLFTSDGSYNLVGVLAVGLGVIATLGTFIYVIVLCATDSEPYDNRFGPSVKYDPVEYSH